MMVGVTVEQLVDNLAFGTAEMMVVQMAETLAGNSAETLAVVLVPETVG
jgi:type IV secretory pathway VirB2 component (pilin)